MVSFTSKMTPRGKREERYTEVQITGSNGKKEGVQRQITRLDGDIVHDESKNLTKYQIQGIESGVPPAPIKPKMLSTRKAVKKSPKRASAPKKNRNK